MIRVELGVKGGLNCTKSRSDVGRLASESARVLTDLGTDSEACANRKALQRHLFESGFAAVAESAVSARTSRERERERAHLSRFADGGIDDVRTLIVPRFLPDQTIPLIPDHVTRTASCPVHLSIHFPRIRPTFSHGCRRHETSSLPRGRRVQLSHVRRASGVGERVLRRPPRPPAGVPTVYK